MFRLHVYMCTTFMLCTHSDQKKGSVPMELDLWLTVNHHVGTKN